MAQLISDLNDIKNQYLDPISYLQLISAKPDEFNPKLIPKILSNFKKQVPFELLISIYKFSEEYAIELSKSTRLTDDMKNSCLHVTGQWINPLCINGITSKMLSGGDLTL